LASTKRTDHNNRGKQTYHQKIMSYVIDMWTNWTYFVIYIMLLCSVMFSDIQWCDDAMYVRLSMVLEAYMYRVCFLFWCYWLCWYHYICCWLLYFEYCMDILLLFSQALTKKQVFMNVTCILMGGVSTIQSCDNTYILIPC
jgi:hypothetical protein